MEEQTIEPQKELPKAVEEIKKNLKTKNLVFGAERTLKLVRSGKIAKVFMSSNPRKDISGDLLHYSKIAGVEIVKLELPNEELGTFCKKPYSVSVIGLVK